MSEILDCRKKVVIHKQYLTFLKCETYDLLPADEWKTKHFIFGIPPNPDHRFRVLKEFTDFSCSWKNKFPSTQGIS